MAHALISGSFVKASAPPFLGYEDEDGVDDLSFALRLQRFYEGQEEQASVDEAIAYSLTMEQTRRIHTYDGLDQETKAEKDSKPPPQCSCCLEGLPRVAQRRVMPCGHVYCELCVATRCKMVVRDRSMAPAHCCLKEFPSEYVQQALSRDEYATYDRFVDERRGGATSELVSDAEYAAAVASHGWKQCPQCGVGVEKISGCDAVRCLRGHLFCWACAHSPCQCGSVTFAYHQRHG